MVQFNLLPDVKIEYLRARRQKHLVILLSTFAAIGGVTLLIILFGVVYGVQKKNLSDLSRDISSNAQKLQATPDLDKILTVQNQLNSLSGLHAEKPVGPRLFSFLTQVTPAQASISKLTVDFAQRTLTINGGADSLDRVNTYTDTLKFTTFRISGQDSEEDMPAFSNVVLSNFGRDQKGATYTITAIFDPAISDQNNDITLTVPKIISTRSAVEQPSALFQSQGGGQ